VSDLSVRRNDERVRSPCHSTHLPGGEDRSKLAVDVAIPTFNGRSHLRQCLRYLEAQTITHTAIVVDHGSTDDSVRMVREEFPHVRLVTLDRNRGFPVACNRGVEAGAGDAVVLMNNDVEADAEFLEQIVEPLLSDPSVGSVAGVLVRPGGDIIDAVGLTVDPTLAGFPRLRGASPRTAGSRSPLLTGPAGAAGAYRRLAWEEVGGLDEGVLGYGEDVDLALRLQGADWKAVLSESAVAVHIGSASFGRRTSWQRYHGGFSRGYFIRRYNMLRTRWCARTLVTEAAVVVGDALIARDFSALRGRVAGWRAAKGLPKRPFPPRSAVDYTISFWKSLKLRRVVYSS
jgi:N-acetylglucosaminyl-diphospho-decaprenol L-rhamnosyltransferase